ncbi:MAG: tRNA pseudouridine(55) synthase TruB [Terriglobales bacterium]
MDGALIIDKPAGWTSHDVVARARRICQERSIGHLGTLDPAATGVLPLLVGRLTRLAQFFNNREKEYRATLRFGFATDTYDATGVSTGPSAANLPGRQAVEAVLPRFRGSIEQLPPQFSAKKVDGVPAYKHARAGKTVTLAPVRVEIREFELLALTGPDLEFRVTCSSGTYVRALAHDLGAALGVGAHLVQLQRTRVGEFSLAQSHTLDALADLAAAGQLARALLSPIALVPEMPAVVALPDAVSRLRHGQAVNLPDFSPVSHIRVFTSDGHLLAIARRVAGTLFQPQTVLRS